MFKSKKSIVSYDGLSIVFYSSKVQYACFAYKNNKYVPAAERYVDSPLSLDWIPESILECIINNLDLLTIPDSL